MWLIAPQPVVEASSSVFHCLRRICDGYIDGTAVSSPEDHAHWEARGKAAAKMRKLMRGDLGVGPAHRTPQRLGSVLGCDQGVAHGRRFIEFRLALEGRGHRGGYLLGKNPTPPRDGTSVVGVR
jgi:hypothetical protein